MSHETRTEGYKTWEKEQRKVINKAVDFIVSGGPPDTHLPLEGLNHSLELAFVKGMAYGMDHESRTKEHGS